LSDAEPDPDNPPVSMRHDFSTRTAPATWDSDLGGFGFAGPLLEFDQVREQIAAYTKTVVGGERARALTPTRDLLEIATRQQETSEARQYLDQGGGLEFGPEEDFRELLQRALLGGLLYIDWLDFNMSVAVIVGFLALLGVAAETAIVMIVYLQESVEEALKRDGTLDKKSLRAAIFEGAVQRVRPKLMTVFAILAGLLPIMYNHGVGSEVMQRIAAPMIGGVVSSAVLSLLIIPLLYEIYTSKTLLKKG